MNNTVNCSSHFALISINAFFTCYKYFFQQEITNSLLTVVLIVGVVTLNALVIILIIKNNSTDLNVFNKILLSYTILDCITGLIDITFYHVYTLFAYWPFDLTSSRIWFSYDNSVNTISCFHMLYICWSRLRCVQKPVSYKKEFLLRKSNYIILLIWISGFLIWTPIVFLFDELKHYRLELNNSIIVLLFQIFFWFLPLVFTFILFIIIYYYLQILKTRRDQINNVLSLQNKSLFETLFKYHLEIQSVFTIIMTVYF
jgi:hypothetical protein